MNKTSAAALGLTLLLTFGLVAGPIHGQIAVQQPTMPKATAASVKQYPVINTPESAEFLKQSILYARQLYGAPRVSVRSVTIRYRPSEPFTILTDEKAGDYAVVLSHKPGDYSFYGQVAHESFHLLNTRLLDCYAEGLATLFSEKMLKKTGKDWLGWESHYKRGNDPFYGNTYLMMKELETLAGAPEMRTLLKFALADPDTVMYIDIDSWIATLPAKKQPKAKRIILNYAPSIEASRTSAQSNYRFRLPE